MIEWDGDIDYEVELPDCPACFCCAEGACESDCEPGCPCARLRNWIMAGGNDA